MVLFALPLIYYCDVSAINAVRKAFINKLDTLVLQLQCLDRELLRQLAATGLEQEHSH
jgi:hypothetical protein